MIRKHAWPYGDTRAPADAFVVVLLVCICAATVWPLLRIGWVPSDEGTLAASALRVYNGQLPHRDFNEVYTGGLSLWNALALHCFGLNLVSLRLAAFSCFLLWVPAVYLVARRFLSPTWAAIATLAAVSWSYPNYVAAMPSWYNLFFATWGTVALLRYLEGRVATWLFIAGLCGGASILVKITGLYYIAAVLLFFLFVEQTPTGTSGDGHRPWGYRTVCGAGLLVYLAALLRLLWPQLRAGEAFLFFFPSAAAVALLVGREWQQRSYAGSGRFRRLAGLLLPFGAGVLVPLALFLIPYARSGAVGALLKDVLGSTTARVAGLAGRLEAPPVGYALYGFATVSILLFAMFSRAARSRTAVASFAVGLAAVLACSALLPGLQDTWLMGGELPPFLVVLGCLILLWGSVGGHLAQQRLALLVFLAAVCPLVQFPVSYVTYFLYAAPLVLLAAVAVFASRPAGVGRAVGAALLVFFLAFGWLGLIAKHVYDPELRIAQARRLELPRAGGLKVEPTSEYPALVPFLQSHSPNGMMYAGDDCPQLYFLSGLQNATRDDTGAPDAEVLQALRTGHLHLVVLNDVPFFASGRISTQLRAAVVRALPNTTRIGAFSVYWN